MVAISRVSGSLGRTFHSDHLHLLPAASAPRMIDLPTDGHDPVRFRFPNDTTTYTHRITLEQTGASPALLSPFSLVAGAHVNVGPSEAAWAV